MLSILKEQKQIARIELRFIVKELRQSLKDDINDLKFNVKRYFKLKILNVKYIVNHWLSEKVYSKIVAKQNDLSRFHTAMDEYTTYRDIRNDGSMKKLYVSTSNLKDYHVILREVMSFDRQRLYNITLKRQVITPYDFFFPDNTSSNTLYNDKLKHDILRMSTTLNMFLEYCNSPTPKSSNMEDIEMFKIERRHPLKDLCFDISQITNYILKREVVDKEVGEENAHSKQVKRLAYENDPRYDNESYIQSA